MNKHPVQPIQEDDTGTRRFKPNKIVRHLLETSALSLNTLSSMEFDDEDREQFAQLIGYSFSGFEELPYASRDTIAAAARMIYEGETEEQAKISSLQETLESIRHGLRVAVTAAFNISTLDLEDRE